MQGLQSKIETVYGAFSDYAPRRYSCPGITGYLIGESYHLTRWQGFVPEFNCYPLNDLIEGRKSTGKDTVIEYVVEFGDVKIRMPVFTVGDFWKINGFHSSDEKGKQGWEKSDIQKILTEKIAWTTVYNWLTTVMRDGRLVENRYKETHVFANSEKYVLKVRDSPNMVLLDKGKKGSTDYNPLKEIDGLFLYDKDNISHVIVQETKSNGFSVGLDDLVENLFNPLKDIFPNSKIIYLLFNNMDSIYVGRDSKERKETFNKIRNEPTRIFKRLLEEGVGTIYFGYRFPFTRFNEFNIFLKKQQAILNNGEVDLTCKYSNGRIRLFVGDMPINILFQEEPNLWVAHPPKQ